MVQVFSTAGILSILLLVTGCDNTSQPDRFLFNSDWHFTRINPEDSTKVEIENQGIDWSSQFDVTHTSSDQSIQIDPNELESELKYIESVIWEEVSIPHTPRIEDLTVLHQWHGVCYYKKEFTANTNWKDQICLMEFEGACRHFRPSWTHLSNFICVIKEENNEHKT